MELFDDIVYVPSRAPPKEAPEGKRPIEVVNFLDKVKKMQKEMLQRVQEKTKTTYLHDSKEGILKIENLKKTLFKNLSTLGVSSSPRS